MAQASSPDVIQLFKKVYGKMQDLLPEGYMFQDDIPFNESMKVGDSYVESVVLSNETGWTLMGSGAELNELNPAIAGVVRQIEVKPYETVLASVIPWGTISRSAGGGEKAFFAATKHVVKNNLKSHGKLLEILRIYGQATDLLGYVSYYTGSYRGVAFTNGSGTVNGVTFTNGINAAAKAILFQKGSFSSGVWIGIEGAIIQEIDATGAVIQEGKVKTIQSLYGYITVDFTPTAATSATSHRICLQGQAAAKDAPGIVNILSNNGTLFGIPTSQYSLWRGNVYSCANQKLTLGVVQTAIAEAVNRGSLDGDLVLYVNPRTWARLITTEAGLRHYDASYKSGEFQNGAEAIKFFSQNGSITIRSHRYIKEGIAPALHLEDWSRSGSAEISFKVPGMGDDLIFPAQNMSAWLFRSYADQYIFCNAPARSVLFTDIDDEAA